MLKVVLMSWFVGSGLLLAHEDPHDVIDTLTHQLEQAEGDKADIYFQRAMEYRVSGQKLKAKADMVMYTAREPRDYLGWLELSKLEDDGVKRFDLLTKSLEVSESDSEREKVYYEMAESHYADRVYAKALSACERSIQLGNGGELTALLFKGHLLWRLGRLEERVEFLGKARERNSSVVLERAWIDAKIGAGQGDEVKAMILQEMQESRFKSSWQIRAARCEVVGSDAAKGYAKLAVEEIDKRLNPERPDVTLLMDLVRAYSIMGDEEKMGYYMKKAKAQRCDPWAMAELEEEIK
jgi:tetratricopeptide (TPR) repeat protein